MLLQAALRFFSTKAKECSDNCGALTDYPALFWLLQIIFLPRTYTGIEISLESGKKYEHKALLAMYIFEEGEREKKKSRNVATNDGFLLLIFGRKKAVVGLRSNNSSERKLSILSPFSMYMCLCLSWFSDLAFLLFYGQRSQEWLKNRPLLHLTKELCGNSLDFFKTKKSASLFLTRVLFQVMKAEVTVWAKTPHIPASLCTA